MKKHLFFVSLKSRSFTLQMQPEKRHYALCVKFCILVAESKGKKYDETGHVMGFEGFSPHPAGIRWLEKTSARTHGRDEKPPYTTGLKA